MRPAGPPIHHIIRPSPPDRPTHSITHKAKSNARRQRGQFVVALLYMYTPLSEGRLCAIASGECLNNQTSSYGYHPEITYVSLLDIIYTSQGAGLRSPVPTSLTQRPSPFSLPAALLVFLRVPHRKLASLISSGHALLANCHVRCRHVAGPDAKVLIDARGRLAQSGYECSRLDALWF